MFGFHRRHGRHEHENCGHWDGMRERMQRGGDGFGGPFGGGRRGPFGGRDREGLMGGGRGGRGGGRFFDHGDLRLLILALVAEKPRHGYEIIKAIEERVNGAYSPSPGVVYPTLTLLEELGYVTVETVAGNRKQYAITEEGKTFLAANETEVRVIFARMNEAAGDGGGARHPQIVRAMENFRLALRLRLVRGDLGPDAISAIAAALDEAASRIEKS